MPTLLDDYFFQQLFPMAESWKAVGFGSGICRFLSTNISQGSAATQLRRSGISD